MNSGANGKPSILFRFGDGFALGLLWLCTGLVIAGGWVFRGEHSIVEVGDLAGWALVPTLILCALARREDRSRAWSYVKKVVEAGLSQRRPWFTWGLVFFFVSLMVAHILRYLTLNTNVWDMGIVHSSLHFPYEGKFLSCEICRSETYLGEHLSFTFALIAPLTAWLKSSILVFALQKLFIIAGIYLIAAKGPLRDAPELRAWWLFFVVANQGLRAGLLFDFREDAMMYAFFLLAAWGIYRGAGWALLLGVLGSLLSKENAFASTFMLAGTIWFARETPWNRQQRNIWAALTAVISVVYAGLAFKVFMPYFIGEQGQNHIALLDRFPGMGNTPTELILNFLKNPFAFFWMGSKYAFTMKGLTYVLLLLSSTLFMAWRKWPWLLPALPAFAFNLISAGPGQRNLAYHYDLIIVAWLGVAIAFALKDLQRDPVGLRKKLKWGVLIALVTFGRSPLFYAWDLLQQDARKIRAGWEVQFLHPTEPVAADYFVVANLTHLKKLRTFWGHERKNEMPAPAQLKEWAVSNNDYPDPNGEGRPPQDARTYFIRGDQTDQAWLIPEFVRLGGKVIYSSQELNDRPALVAVELPATVYELLCQVDQVCIQPPAPTETKKWKPAE